MPTGLRRLYGQNHLHFVTFSCWHRRPQLRSAVTRDLFVRMLGEVRDKMRFLLVGYVVMPDHVHLIVSEPPQKSVSTAVQVVKQRTSRRFEPAHEFRADPHIWQTRFYDFNIYSEEKLREKLKYVHLNPVKEKLVENGVNWAWSSFAFYETGKLGLVRIDVVD